MCTDVRCTDGATMCRGCNGFGVVNPKGKAYRQKRNVPIPEWAEPHGECHGTGLAVCGCVELDAATLAYVTGRQLVSA